jgi:hypothetical protein
LSQTSEITRVPDSAFYEKLDEIINKVKNVKDVFHEAVQIARQQGFSDPEIAVIMSDYLADKIAKSTLKDWVKPLKQITTERIRPITTEESSSTKVVAKQVRLTEAMDTLMESRRNGILSGYFFWKEVKQ